MPLFALLPFSGLRKCGSLSGLPRPCTNRAMLAESIRKSVYVSIRPAAHDTFPYVEETLIHSRHFQDGARKLPALRMTAASFVFPFFISVTGLIEGIRARVGILR